MHTQKSGAMLLPVRFVIFVGGALCLMFAGHAGTLYVSPQGTNNAAGNFPDWAGAATNIQTAVTAAASGDTVLVTNATYALTNEINTAGHGITLRSWNNGALDPTNTILDGQGTTRCV